MISGRVSFRRFDANGNEIFNSGEAPLPAPTRDVADITNNDTVNANVADFMGASNTGYRLDGVGNWVERNVDGSSAEFVANEMNEYDEVGGVAQAYDDNGNLTNDGTRKYFYDFANRLVRVTDSAGVEIARYVYDALGRRIRKVVGGTTTSFLHDGAREVEEREGGVAFAVPVRRRPGPESPASS